MCGVEPPTTNGSSLPGFSAQSIFQHSRALGLVENATLPLREHENEPIVNDLGDARRPAVRQLQAAYGRELKTLSAVAWHHGDIHRTRYVRQLGRARQLMG